MNWLWQILFCNYMKQFQFANSEDISSFGELCNMMFNQGILKGGLTLVINLKIPTANQSRELVSAYFS